YLATPAPLHPPPPVIPSFLRIHVPQRTHHSYSQTQGGAREQLQQNPRTGIQERSRDVHSIQSLAKIVELTSRSVGSAGGLVTKSDPSFSAFHFNQRNSTTARVDFPALFLGNLGWDLSFYYTAPSRSLSTDEQDVVLKFSVPFCFLFLFLFLLLFLFPGIMHKTLLQLNLSSHGCISNCVYARNRQ
ncbi:hypothetical protein DFH07DRAFT_846428, partial [Mycena maculata]